MTERRMPDSDRTIAGLLLSSLALCFVICGSPLLAQSADTGAERDAGADFVPPSDGPPGDRAGAGTRAAGGVSGPLTLIAPAGGGLTTLAAPPLVWRLSEPVRGDILAGIGDTDPSGSGVSGTFRGPFAAGLYAIDLGRSAMRLEEGHIYRFTVSVVEPGGVAVLAEASTFVERVASGDAGAAGQEEAETGAAGATPGDAAGDLKRAAAAGLWFDALDVVVEPDLSGRARVVLPRAYDRLIGSAGLE
ncbi:MAG: hypothetical protein ACKVPY_16650 [Paracoccaceae bacterium]